MYLFFDTETNGLPRNWKAPVSDLSNWPRMIQVAWILCSGDGERLESASYIIRPEGFEIPAEASAVHGITTEIALNEGVKLNEVLLKFAELTQKAQYLVAHNISFDEKIIGAELLRKQVPSRINSLNQLCTMKASTDYCRIPGPYGFKWPKLSELHIKLFGVDFEGAHDAFADIDATERSFWKMRELNLI